MEFFKDIAHGVPRLRRENSPSLRGQMQDLVRKQYVQGGEAEALVDSTYKVWSGFVEEAVLSSSKWQIGAGIQNGRDFIAQNPLIQFMLRERHIDNEEFLRRCVGGHLMLAVEQVIFKKKFEGKDSERMSYWEHEGVPFNVGIELDKHGRELSLVAASDGVRFVADTQQSKEIGKRVVSVLDHLSQPTPKQLKKCAFVSSLRSPAGQFDRRMQFVLIGTGFGMMRRPGAPSTTQKLVDALTVYGHEVGHSKQRYLPSLLAEVDAYGSEADFMGAIETGVKTGELTGDFPHANEVVGATSQARNDARSSIRIMLSRSLDQPFPNFLFADHNVDCTRRQK